MLYFHKQLYFFIVTPFHRQKNPIKRSLFSLSFIIGMLFLSHSSHAQVTTNPITLSPLCPGSEVPVSYSASIFILDNFTVQLSDASGSFAAPTDLGNETLWGFGTQNSTFTVTIPTGTAAGTNYRIRVVGIAAGTGSDNGSNLTINTTIVAGIPGTFTTGPTTVCAGENNITYTVNTVTGAVSYDWSYSGTGVTFNGTGNSVTADFSTTATSGTINVRSVNVNGCIGPTVRTRGVTVNPLPAQPGAYTASSTSVCQGQTGVAYTVPAVAGATSYAWTYTGTGVSFSSTNRNVTASFNGTATSGIIRVAAVNACGAGSTRDIAVTVGTPTAQPNNFTTSSANVCRNNTNIAYSVPTVAGATSYTWTYSGTGATISGGTTNAVTINFSGTATSGTLSVVANSGGCVSTARSMAITVSTTTPGTPGTFSSGATTVCQGQTGVTYVSGTGTNAISYQWTYSGTGLTFNGTSNSVTGDYANNATGGTISVRSVNACGTSAARTRGPITVNNLPAQPGAYTASTATVCQGQNNVSYTIPAVTGATSYTWNYSGTGATISGGTTRSITINFSASATSGTLSGAAINACGAGTTRDIAITVNPLPVSSASNDGPVCIGNTLTLSTPTIGGATYAWTGPAGFISSAQNPTLSYSLLNAGLYTVQVTAGGCSANFNTTVTSNSALGLWTGMTNSDWNTLSNWCGGTAFGSVTDVIVPSTAPHMPAVSSSVSCRNITIASGASVTNTPSGTLNIHGNFINTGTYNDDGLTAFVGTVPQLVSGADTLHSVNVNNTAGITLLTPTYVKGHLTLTSGTLASGGNLTVDLNTGAIRGTGTGAISGNMTVLKWIWSDKYHYISSPLSGRTVADWNDDVLIKFGANANLYTYDETVPNTDKEVGWVPVPSTTTTIENMKGYALYFPRWIYKTTMDLTGSYNHSATYTSPTLTNTPSGVPASDGWHVVGNPYPCVIDWNAASGWTKTGLDNAIYFWDSQNNRYASYVAGIGVNGGTQYIPAMQGFYIKVSTSGGTGTLAMNNNVRTTAANPDVWRIASEEKIIRLKASNGTFEDETYVRFSEYATENFDSHLDAYKIPNGENTPSIATKTGRETYSVNSIPMSIENKIIPIPLMVGIADTYTINANLTGFESTDIVLLEDRQLNTVQDLFVNPSYSTSLVQGDTATRFFLHYKKETKQNMVTNNEYEASKNAGIYIYAHQQNINISLGQDHGTNAHIVVFDAIGNKIHEIENATIQSNRINFELANAPTGIYIVKVETNTGNKTQQVYISR